jgi:hypothetical protein
MRRVSGQVPPPTHPSVPDEKCYRRTGQRGCATGTTRGLGGTGAACFDLNGIGIDEWRDGGQYADARPSVGGRVQLEEGHERVAERGDVPGESRRYVGLRSASAMTTDATLRTAGCRATTCRCAFASSEQAVRRVAGNR